MHHDTRLLCGLSSTPFKPSNFKASVLIDASDYTLLNISAAPSLRVINLEFGLAHDGLTRGATLSINPASQSADIITISRVEYDTSKRTLRVEATGTRTDATLQVFFTASGQLIGALANNSGRYSGQFTLSINSQSITVRSNLEVRR
jgi:hypothetical protein